MAPPTGNGGIVYISIEDPNESCYKHDPPWTADSPLSDELYSVELPNDPVVLSNGERLKSGGLSINLRGNRKPAGTGCRFDGFYMNEPVFGVHQGWVETYFAAIDQKRIVASNHYCMAR